MILTPRGRWLLVSELPADANPYGIYVPETAREDVRRGEILALGGEVQETVFVGDTVYYARPAAIVMEVARREFLFVEEKRLYAVERMTLDRSLLDEVLAPKA